MNIKAASVRIDERRWTMWSVDADPRFRRCPTTRWVQLKTRFSKRLNHVSQEVELGNWIDSTVASLVAILSYDHRIRKVIPFLISPPPFFLFNFYRYSREPCITAILQQWRAWNTRHNPILERVSSGFSREFFRGIISGYTSPSPPLWFLHDTPNETFIREIISRRSSQGIKLAGMAPRRVTVARRTVRFLRHSFRLDKTFLPTSAACKLARGIPYALSRHPIDAHSAVSSIEIAFHPERNPLGRSVFFAG